mgnify:CR=1 FL=1
MAATGTRGHDGGSERLPADPLHPDSTFIEDTAIVTARGAIATRPGAPSRIGEVDSVVAALRRHYNDVAQIVAPGTVDGGDVCEADDHFLIGLSSRTNEQGVAEVEFLATSGVIDDVHILAASPMASGQARFVVHVTLPGKQE